MASYPTSVFSPTSKNTGDTIQASHVNDAQAELTAIENGLLNGIVHPVTFSSGVTIGSGGPLNVASASSLTTLSVSGGSTFVGAVTLTGGIDNAVTLSSGAVVSTGVVRQNSLPAWSVYRSAVLAVATPSSGGIQWNQQDFVRGNVAHSTATASSGITVNSTGLYQIAFNSKIHSGSNPRLSLTVRLGSSDLVTHLVGDADTTLPDQSIAFAMPVRIDSTGVVSVVFHETNAVSTLGSATAAEATRFAGWFLG